MLMSEEVEVLTPAPRNVAVLRERWGPLCPPPPQDTPSLTSRRSRIRRKEKPSLPVLEGASASRLSPSWPLGLIEPVLAPPGRSPLSKPGASPHASATLSDPLSPHTRPPTLPFPVSLSPAPERLDCVSSASVCGGRGGGGLPRPSQTQATSLWPRCVWGLQNPGRHLLPISPRCRLRGPPTPTASVAMLAVVQTGDDFTSFVFY